MRRRRDADDPMADVPERLRAFHRGWLEVAAQSQDGYEEALEAAHEWLERRRAWQLEHGYRGSPLEWIRADIQVRRDVWRASQVWRPESERWMTRASQLQPRREVP